MDDQNQRSEQDLLKFLSLADAEAIDKLGEDAVNLGETLAKRIVEAREKYEGGIYSVREQVLAVKGLGEQRYAQLLSVFERNPEHKGMLKSRTMFSFAGRPPCLDEYRGEIHWERSPKVELDEKLGAPESNELDSYELYYEPRVNKEQLFKAIRSSRNFRHSIDGRQFAIQVRNGQFVTGYPNSSVLLRDLYFAAHLSIHSELRPGHLTAGNFPATHVPMWARAVSMHFDFSGMETYLSWDAAHNRVRCMDLTQQTPGPRELWDVSGILQPYWGNSGTFESFTMMPWIQSVLPAGADPREIIEADPQIGSSTGLVGQNSQVGWERDAQMRYVEVIENVRVRAIENSSHTGAQSNQMFLSVNSQGEVSSVHVAPGANNPPVGTFFDMYVLYGHFDNRDDIVCNIMLKSRMNGRLLGTGGPLGEEVRCDNSYTHIAPNVKWEVERGWGNTPWRVALRSEAGKYLFNWRHVVNASTVEVINMEQWEIVTP